MEEILSQITNLLVQPSGSLVYHLVIAFIFISILQPALTLLPAGEASGRRRRLLIGSGLLILSRLVIFAFSLAALISGNTGSSLGVIELAVTAFDFTVIVWLFAFPTENRTADIALTLFGLGLLAAGAVSAIYWGLQGDAEAFNQSALAFIWQLVTFGILIIGLFTVNRSNTPARAQGVILLGILLVGEGLQMITAVPSGDLFPISRLAHLAGLPLLTGLFQNFVPSGESTAVSLRRMAEESAESLDEEDPFDLLVEVTPAETETEEIETSGLATKALPLHIFQNSLALAGSESPKQTCQLFTRLTAHALVADICLLLTQPDQNRQVHLVSGYDLIVQESLHGTSFDASLIPRFDKVFSTGRPIQVLDQGNERMAELADLLQVDEIGNLLAYPVTNPEGEAIAAIVLVSPYSKRVWNADDQEYFKAAIPAVNAVLQKALGPQRNERAVENLNEQLALSNTDRQRLVEEKEQLEQEIESLRTLLSDTGENFTDPEAAAAAGGLAGLLETIGALEEENSALEEKLAQMSARNQSLAEAHERVLKENEQLAAQAQTPQEVQAQLDALNFANQDLARKNAEFEQLNEELAARNTRFAKQTEQMDRSQTELAERITELAEENKQLHALLANGPEPTEDSEHAAEAAAALANARLLEAQLEEAQQALQGLMDLHGRNGGAASEEQNEVIASIAQELRQPLSSISGYTDLLISESVGILGALQKKFLERVKASSERMQQLIDDLVQVATLDSGKFMFSVQPMALMDVIDNAIDTTGAQYREKELALRVDILPDLPKLHTDRDALQQIVLHLMNNAGAATPVGGEVTLRAKIYDKSNNDVILLSVTDSGEGIPKEELPRVFSRLYRADNPLIEGVGDTGVGLSIAKTLTEALGGRIWVESQRGEGSTYSVLMPINSPSVATAEPEKAGRQTE